MKKTFFVPRRYQYPFNNMGNKIITEISKLSKKYFELRLMQINGKTGKSIRFSPIGSNRNDFQPICIGRTLKRF